MTFASREDAGRRLGEYLKERGMAADLILGLPRGGVVVAAEVARVLHLPLDVIVVRKIGHPLHREFAIGALAEENIAVLNESVVARSIVNRDDLMRVIEEETNRLRDYRERFHRDAGVDREGKSVLIIDDGLATGSTMEAAVKSARKQGADEVRVAVPVASTNAVERLEVEADEVISLWIDPDFEAVGRYYEEFSQTSDGEVVDLLHANERFAS